MLLEDQTFESKIEIIDFLNQWLQKKWKDYRLKLAVSSESCFDGSVLSFTDLSLVEQEVRDYGFSQFLQFRLHYNNENYALLSPKPDKGTSFTFKDKLSYWSYDDGNIYPTNGASSIGGKSTAIELFLTSVGFDDLLFNGTKNLHDATCDILTEDYSKNVYTLLKPHFPDLKDVYLCTEDDEFLFSFNGGIKWWSYLHQILIDNEKVANIL